MNFNKKCSRGFTLIELLVVIAIIGVLAGILMVVLSSGKTKSNDAKIATQVGQMTSQGFLYSGAMPGGSGAVVSPYLVSAGITGASTTGTSPMQLFNATNTSLNSLYSLASTLPGTAYIYYGWDGANPNTTGKWFFAVTTSTGAYCNDNKGTKKTYVGTSISTNPTLASSWTAVGVFPNAVASSSGFRCD